ncbi:fungal-specific transcription factor domain-domain-containing protein [Naematelia encephala]|uniref:Fungal-specific transcription factor domain-domain-containing protein n=1 Tax=Naematelia encephala TaxID=71784 RepID=A0A1Y2AKM6_9TREE|nr:fungal-specific transcription factor domain-domain-containing protein [Naematelia encephala]
MAAEVSRYQAGESSSVATTSHTNGADEGFTTPDGEPNRGRKRTGITRTRKACVLCRLRKCRCHGVPPDPCPQCQADDYPCQWPEQDGRSSKARKLRARTGASSVKTETPQPNGGLPQAWTMSNDWLEGLDTGPPSAFVQNPQADAGSLSWLSGDDPTLTNFSGVDLPEFEPSAFDSMPPDLLGRSAFVMAMSSRLPTVEESSTLDETSPVGLTARGTRETPSQITPGTTSVTHLHKQEDKEKVVKLTWWRPHGQTAIAPGLKRITLKVRVDSPRSTRSAASPMTVTSIGNDTMEVIGENGMPNPVIMSHLLDVFMEHFGCQFPCLNRAELDQSLASGTGSVFLFTCIAAIAARFSKHPAIALPSLRPHEYGDSFGKVAKNLQGSMLAVPSRDTIIALLLLAHLGFANDSESEEWMFTGMAVRMAIDLGLHLVSEGDCRADDQDPGEESDISAEERRLNRLVFWSVLLLDFALAFGVGRQTTFRVEEITQALPNEADIHPLGISGDHPRSPFPFAARQMISYGPLINLLNGAQIHQADYGKLVQHARAQAMREYNNLPQDMQWNVTNLQRQSRAQQAPMFLHLHLWMHNIIASGYLTGTDYLRRPGVKTAASGLKSGAVTPNTVTASNLWRNSARTIGDVLVLTDIVNSTSYLSLPFVNQAFFVAGCCYVKELEQSEEDSPSRQSPTLVDTEHSDGHEKRPAELFQSLLRSVATNNISTLQQGLAKLTTYWSGVAWVAEALQQRLSGVQASDLDLKAVTEKLSSSVSVGDPGLIRGGSERMEAEADLLSGFPGVLNVDIADFDFLSSLPFTA